MRTIDFLHQYIMVRTAHPTATSPKIALRVLRGEKNYYSGIKKAALKKSSFFV